MDSIHVDIIGAESMGVRSMCTKVRTPDITLMLDPGCALGPRKGHEVPHPREYRKLHEITGKILRESRDCTHISISHYHHDHFKPRLRDELYIHSTPDIVKELYMNKDLFVKSARGHIGKNQKSRCRYFKQSVTRLVGRIKDSDSLRFTFGDTVIDFSWPVFHGEYGTRLGYVIMTRIRYKDECFIHAPDIQGPVVDETCKFFTDVPVDLAFIGGPPLYLGGSLGNFPFNRARENLASFHRSIPTVVLDHHCCRSEQEYYNFLEGIRKDASVAGLDGEGHVIIDAATFMGREPSFLEATRDSLFKTEPPGEEFLSWMDSDKVQRNQITPPLR
ncbi:MAG: MBL fold metallo-hydrolase [Promethearchaeota archaeon]